MDPRSRRCRLSAVACFATTGTSINICPGHAI
jgi:hypothetical protein